MEKQKRIRRVFSGSSEVIHRWANQTQEDARCANVFFSGKSIYSYGYHYELGRMIKYNGIEVALINNRGYSVTTSKHIRDAWNGVSHKIRLNMPSLSRSIGEITKEHIEECLLLEQGLLIESLFEYLSRRSFYEGYEVGIDPDYKKYGDEAHIAEFNTKAKALGFSHLTLNIKDEHFSLINSHIKLSVEKEKQRQTPEAIAKRDELRAKREAKELEKAQTDINQWLAGGPKTERMKKVLPCDYIRSIGDKIETSRGVKVDLDDAKELMTKVLAGSAKSGDKVGHYTFTSAKADIVRVGCHTFNLEQCKAVLLPLMSKTEVIYKGA